MATTVSLVHCALLHHLDAVQDEILESTLPTLVRTLGVPEQAGPFTALLPMFQLVQAGLVSEGFDLTLNARVFRLTFIGRHIAQAGWNVSVEETFEAQVPAARQAYLRSRVLKMQDRTKVLSPFVAD